MLISALHHHGDPSHADVVTEHRHPAPAVRRVHHAEPLGFQRSLNALRNHPAAPGLWNEPQHVAFLGGQLYGFGALG